MGEIDGLAQPMGKLDGLAQTMGKLDRLASKKASSGRRRPRSGLLRGRFSGRVYGGKKRGVWGVAGPPENFQSLGSK